MQYFNASSPSAAFEFGAELYRIISSDKRPQQPLVFLCIGSDRATGDSLGPLIGYKLKQHCYDRYAVYGTLAEPVHAKNLATVISDIYHTFPAAYVVAIDASLGKASHIGYFTLSKGALKPGAGVGKELPDVGNLCVTGIVNLSGFLEHSLLQTTRLHTVMSLADPICSGIFYCVTKLERSMSSHPLRGISNQY